MLLKWKMIKYLYKYIYECTYLTKLYTVFNLIIQLWIYLFKNLFNFVLNYEWLNLHLHKKIKNTLLEKIYLNCKRSDYFFLFKKLSCITEATQIYNF